MAGVFHWLCFNDRCLVIRRQDVVVGEHIHVDIRQTWIPVPLLHLSQLCDLRQNDELL